MITVQDIRMELPFASSMYQRLRRLLRLGGRPPSPDRALTRVLIAAFVLSRNEAGFAKAEFVARAKQIADFLSEAAGDEPMRVNDARIIEAHEP